MQLHDLRPVDEALPAVEDELGLGVAPLGQGGRPLLGPADVEQLVASRDNRAVGVAHSDGRDLPGADGHHGLVQRGDPAVDLAQIDGAAALADGARVVSSGSRYSSPIATAWAKGGVGAGDVAREDAAQAGGVAQVALLDALDAPFGEQALGPVHPAAALGRLAAVE